MMRRLGFRQAVHAAEITAIGHAHAKVAQSASMRIGEKLRRDHFRIRIKRADCHQKNVQSNHLNSGPRTVPVRSGNNYETTVGKLAAITNENPLSDQ